MLKKSILNIFCALIAAGSLLHCKSTGGREDPKNANTVSGFTEPSIESKDRIDGEKTYEIFFRPGQYEDCLRFLIRAHVPGEEPDKKGGKIKPYFIIEKAVDISHFAAYLPAESPGGRVITAAGRRIIFSEMGRNFDHNWMRRGKVTLCSLKEDPIRKFDTSLFRIRFTLFRDESFNYTITIFSRHAIVFSTNEGVK